jgi:TatD DNase family protein
MPLFDAHCHLDQLDDPAAAIDRAAAAGVTRILAVSEGLEACKAVLALRARRPESVLAGLGIHPMFSVSLPREEVREGLAFIEAHVAEAHAVGEIGLDYMHAKTEEQKQVQHALLEDLLALAAAARKPVNLHSRRAQRQTMERAAAFKRETGLNALMHWFTASKKLVRACGEAGLYVSAGPSVLIDPLACDVAKTIPDALLLVETDSPVLFGGAPAEPAWAAKVAEKLAEVRGVSLSVLERQLSENFDRYLGG